MISCMFLSMQFLWFSLVLKIWAEKVVLAKIFLWGRLLGLYTIVGRILLKQEF
jgi:hypothetical protein